MRLIDADALEYHEIDEIGGEYEPYLGCSKEYIDRQPTVDVLEQIRAEIEHEGDMFPDGEFFVSIDRINEIIDKYTGRKEQTI